MSVARAAPLVVRGVFPRSGRYGERSGHLWESRICSAGNVREPLTAGAINGSTPTTRTCMTTDAAPPSCWPIRKATKLSRLNPIVCTSWTLWTFFYTRV